MIDNYFFLYYYTTFYLFIFNNLTYILLRTVGEKRTLIEAIRERHWKMVGHVMRHPEELYNIILEV